MAKGIKGPFYPRIVWRYLHKHPGMTMGELYIAMRLTRNCVRHALLLLKRSGCAYFDGSTAKARWQATAVEPVDSRGQRKRSQESLLRGRIKNRRGKAPPVPEPATELERCWGWWPQLSSPLLLQELNEHENIGDKGATSAHWANHDRIAQMERELYAEAAD